MEREFRDLTIKEYISTLSQMPYETDLEYQQRRLAIVLRQPIETIKGLPYLVFNDYVEQLKDIENNLKGVRVKKKIKIKGTWYKVDTDILKITASQWIDGTAFSKEAHKDLHKFIAVFLRPMTWRFGKVAEYDGARHKEISEAVFEHMTMKDAQPLVVFFCKVLCELHTHTKTYLVEEAGKIVEDLLKNGDILSQLTTSQIEMLQSGATSLK